MKTKLLFLAVIASSLFYKAQNVTIPDAKFKSYLVNNSSINTNGDSEIQVSEATAFTGAISCASMNIASLTGLEAFVNVTELSCFSNLLTSLDVSKNTALKILVCAGNQLTSLDVTKNLALKELNFHTNQISSVDVSKNTLLNILTFSNNVFTTLDLTKNTALSSLNCENNLLTSLDLSKNTLLENLDCSNNKLTLLDLKNNTVLKQFSCSSNQITSLDLTANPELWILNSVDNQLTNVDLSKNTLLASVDFSNNKLTSFDISNSSVLELLLLPNNQLTSVNIKNGNNAGLYYFDVTGNPNLTCIQVDNVSDANDYTTAGSWIKDSVSSYNISCGSTLGVNDISKNNVKIYPNPTKASLNWSVTSDVDVYNMNGQKVLTDKNISSANLSKLSNGVYIVVLKDKDGNEIHRTKIIKN